MLKPDELTAGLFIWWTRRSEYGRDWDCPGVITHIDAQPDESGRRYFKVLTFDDFGEHEVLLRNPVLDHDSVLNELTLTTKKKIRRYLNDEQRTFEDRVLKKSRELEDLKDQLEEWIKRFHQDYGQIPSRLTGAVQCRRSTSWSIWTTTPISSLAS